MQKEKRILESFLENFLFKYTEGATTQVNTGVIKKQVSLF